MRSEHAGALTRCLPIHCRDRIVDEECHRPDSATGSRRLAPMVGCRTISHLYTSQSYHRQFSPDLQTRGDPFDTIVGSGPWTLLTFSFTSHCLAMLFCGLVRESDAGKMSQKNRKIAFQNVGPINLCGLVPPNWLNTH